MIMQLQKKSRFKRSTHRRSQLVNPSSAIKTQIEFTSGNDDNDFDEDELDQNEK